MTKKMDEILQAIKTLNTKELLQVLLQVNIIYMKMLGDAESEGDPSVFP